MPQQGSAQVVGNIGMYYAAYRLSQQGWNAMPTTRNARGVDLLAYDVGANVYKGIQGPLEALPRPARQLARQVHRRLVGHRHQCWHCQPGVLHHEAERSEDARSPRREGGAHLVLAPAHTIRHG
jgi:hypothetical protein